MKTKKNWKVKIEEEKSRKKNYITCSKNSNYETRVKTKTVELSSKKQIEMSLNMKPMNAKEDDETSTSEYC